MQKLLSAVEKMAFRCFSTRNNFFAALFLILIILLSGISCKSKEPEKKKVYNRGEFIDGDYVYIGVAWPFERRKDMFLDGIKLAVDEVNKNKDFVKMKKKMAISIYDDDQDNDKAKKAARYFAGNSDLIAVIGHTAPNISVYAGVTYNINNILYFAVRATAPSLTKHNLPYLFRTIPSDQHIAILATNVCKNMKLKNIVIVNTLDGYGKELSSVFKTEAIKNDLYLVNQISFFKDNTDYRTLAAKVKNIKEHIDVIFFAGSSTEGTNFIKELRDMEIMIPVVASEPLYSEKVLKTLGKSATDLYVITFYDEDAYSQKKFKDFKKNFKEKFKKDPDKFALQGYECVKIIEEAITKAKTTRTSSLLSYLQYRLEWSGITKKYKFDKYGDVLNSPLSVFGVEKGKFVRYNVGKFLDDKTMFESNSDTSEKNNNSSKKNNGSVEKTENSDKQETNDEQVKEKSDDDKLKKTDSQSTIKDDSANKKKLNMRKDNSVNKEKPIEDKTNHKPVKK